MAKKKEEGVVSKKVTQVSTTGPTTGQYATYQYGAMPSYSPSAYQQKADTMLGQIEKYGNYKSTYQKPINATLGRITDTTPYTSQYQNQIDRYLGLMDQDYDPNSDASYLAYKNQYISGGQKAMQDTLAKAVALSGGYDNSYANSVAQQTYGDYMAGLADKIPELAQAAQDMYMNKLGIYRDLDATDYGRWADDRSNNYNVLNALQGLDNTAYGRWSDKRANLYDLMGAYQGRENQNYNMFQDEFSRWNTAYQQQQALAGGSGGSGGRGGRGGRGGYGSGYDSSSSNIDVGEAARAMAQDGASNAEILAMISSAYQDGVISKASYEIMTKKYANTSNGKTKTGGGSKGTTLNLQTR